MASDTLVPDKVVREEFGISAMTLWRWTHDQELDFPPPVYVRKRKFRSRKLLDEFKQKMMRRGVQSA